MNRWAETTFQVDPRVSDCPIDEAASQLEGYPGLGLVTVDVARQVLVVWYDPQRHALAGVVRILEAVAAPVVLEPLCPSLAHQMAAAA